MFTQVKHVQPPSRHWLSALSLHLWHRQAYEALERRLDLLEARLAALGGAKPSVDSPYLNTEEAPAYLRITPNALYGLVERRKLKPLPGHRKYRFTKEMLDAYLRGE